MEREMNVASLALLELGHALQSSGYSFTTVTPETHRRVNARAAELGQLEARDIRDVFGWSRPFHPDVLPPALLDQLIAADQVAQNGDLLRSLVRFSTLQDRLFVHSAFPTAQSDAVFFGPDTYRFCAFLKAHAPMHARYLVDIGGGSGAGGIVLAERANRCVITDINPKAVDFAAVNAALSAVHVETVRGDVLKPIDGDPDLIVANPPYMRDAAERTYRDGGGEHGEALSLRIVREAMTRLARGGELLLYTGAAIVKGVDTLLAQLTSLLRENGVRPASRPMSEGALGRFAYHELDPDVFGEELSEPQYQDVDRIAVVGMHLRMV